MRLMRKIIQRAPKINDLDYIWILAEEYLFQIGFVTTGITGRNEVDWNDQYD